MNNINLLLLITLFSLAASLKTNANAHVSTPTHAQVASMWNQIQALNQTVALQQQMIKNISSQLIVVHKMLVVRGQALIALMKKSKEDNKKEILADVQAQGLKIGNRWIIREEHTNSTQDLVFRDLLSPNNSRYAMLKGQKVDL